MPNQEVAALIENLRLLLQSECCRMHNISPEDFDLSFSRVCGRRDLIHLVEDLEQDIYSRKKKTQV